MPAIPRFLAGCTVSLPRSSCQRTGKYRSLVQWGAWREIRPPHWVRGESPVALATGLTSAVDFHVGRATSVALLDAMRRSGAGWPLSAFELGESLDDGGVQVSVRRHDAVAVGEPLGAVVEGTSERVREAPAGGGDERIDGAGVPSLAHHPGRDVSVGGAGRDVRALQPGAPHVAGFSGAERRQRAFELR